MSTTDDRTNPAPGGTDTSRDRPAAPRRQPDHEAQRRPSHLVVGAGFVAAAAAGVAVYLLGLPDGVELLGTPLSDLTAPAALLVALLGGSAVGMASARASWRVVDIVVASVLGVAGGLLFAVWNAFVYPGVSAVLVPPVSALLVGVWLLPGVLGGLVIRKPGAAVYTELVAAALSAVIGNQWGFATVYYGLLQGLGAELVLALFLYRYWRLPVALLAGAGTGLTVGILDTTVYYAELVPAVQLAYVACAVVSGVLVAGLGAWALTRAMARTGVLSPLASGRDGRRV